MDAAGTTSDQATRRRDRQREFSVFNLSLIVAAVICGAVIEPTVRIGSIDEAYFDNDVRSAAVVVGVVSLIAGTLGMLIWIVGVERRRPWPFTRRDQAPTPRDWAGIPALITAGAAQLLIPGSWRGDQLYDLGSGRYASVITPAGSAATLVFTFAVFGAAYVVAHFALGRR